LKDNCSATASFKTGVFLFAGRGHHDAPDSLEDGASANVVAEASAAENSIFHVPGSGDRDRRIGDNNMVGSSQAGDKLGVDCCPGERIVLTDRAVAEIRNVQVIAVDRQELRIIIFYSIANE
jgi:hypothetical protein